MDILGDDLPWRKILAYVLEIRTRSQPSGVFRDFISKRWPLGGNPGSKFSWWSPITSKCLFGAWICIWILIMHYWMQNQFSCSVVSNSTIPWTAACQASLSITNSPSLLKLASIESVMPSNHLILCHPFLLMPSVFPSIGSFPVSQFFASGGQTIGVSDSASVFPMNIQDWFPLGLTGWISLQSRGLSRVFNTTV